MSRYTIRHDAKRCINCRACELHCQVIQQAPADIRLGVLITAGPDELPETEKVGIVSAFRPCFHCEKPWCAAVCPTGAIFRRDTDGLVMVLAERCVGCRACVSACPWRVPVVNELTGKMIKCDSCAGRVDVGLLPACVSACTTHALRFCAPNQAVREARLKYCRKKLAAATSGLS
jgi:Fe-S-cluster-containing dehydrogenase component